MWPIIYDRFPALYSPVGLWHCEDLTDSSGNGRDLTLSGDYPYGYGLSPGKQAFEMQQSGTGYTVPLLRRTDAALAVTGALTIGMIFTRKFDFDNTRYLIDCKGAGATEDDNESYCLRLTTSQKLEIRWQTGPARTEVDHEIPISLGRDTPHVLHVRRSATGTVTTFLNGYQVDQAIGLTMPTGGSLGIFQVGGLSTSANGINTNWQGTIGGVAVYDTDLTDVQIQGLAASVTRWANGEWTP